MKRKETGILFRSPMVRAIVDGRKSQTRRIVKPQPHALDASHGDIEESDRYPGEFFQWIDGGDKLPSFHCPYGSEGDQLWVRETFRPCASGAVKNGYGEVRYGYAYKADQSVRWQQSTTKIHDLRERPKETAPMQFSPGRWKSSIHMPRRASRLTLRITEVRVQRLQEISEDDAIAEGFPYPVESKDKLPTPRIWYSGVWESINGKGSWDANPFVWAITFERAA